ncbi:MAG TPA: polymer-forming cytoskeletal protein [Candidatus Udaeobacter sp.]|jgi:cytoskeletal protein CcmA (bactofilin family)|nr:polymer-forming cytoskeletal protein [Candidatus Udaeobacter sp.]
MAWFDRNPGGKKGPEERPVAPEPRHVVPSVPPVAPEPQPAKEPLPAPVAEPALLASLHKGSRVSGQLSFQGSARIDGRVDGEIQCHGKLTIGEGAEIRAKISAQTVVIRGRVEGNVTAKEKVELTAPARLYGNIDSPRLIVTEGVVFDGDCSMGMAKQKGGVANSQSATGDKTAVAEAPKLKADSEK